MVEVQDAVVYYSSTKGRRYFSKRAAINAEACAIILSRCPVVPFDVDTGECYDIRADEGERYDKMHRRLVKVIKDNLEEK